MNESGSNKQPSLKEQLEHDAQLDEAGITRVGRVHGGELKELILPENVRPTYDTNCKHLRTKLSDSTQFDEIECLDCPMVWVYEYGTVRGTMKTT